MFILLYIASYAICCCWSMLSHLYILPTSTHHHLTYCLHIIKHHLPIHITSELHINSSAIHTYIYIYYAIVLLYIILPSWPVHLHDLYYYYIYALQFILLLLLCCHISSIHTLLLLLLCYYYILLYYYILTRPCHTISCHP